LDGVFIIKENSCVEIIIATQVVASPKEAFENLEELEQLEDIYNSARVLAKTTDKVAKTTLEIAQKAFDLLPYLLDEKYEVIRGNTLPQNALWKFGISGDKPIILHYPNYDILSDTEETIKTHAFFSVRGFETDLVLILPENNSYLREGEHKVYLLLERYARGHVKVISKNEIKQAEELLFRSVGTVI